MVISEKSDKTELKISYKNNACKIFWTGINIAKKLN